MTRAMARLEREVTGSSGNRLLVVLKLIQPLPQVFQLNPSLALDIATGGDECSCKATAKYAAANVVGSLRQLPSMPTSLPWACVSLSRVKNAKAALSLASRFVPAVALAV